MQIKASKVDFWRNNIETMKLEYQEKLYPPRVVMSVRMMSDESAPLKLPISFKGCSSDSQLDDMEITFPLGKIHIMACV